MNSRELIITGCVSRDDKPPPRVASLVMRAKLYGLQFRLQDRSLTRLELKPNDFKFSPEIARQGNIAATDINSNKESKA